MSQIVIVATVNALPGAEAALAGILSAMVAPSRQEAGCLRYDLHRDPASPGTFVFLESWESREAHATHKNTPHFVQGRNLQENLVASRDVRILEQI